MFVVFLDKNRLNFFGKENVEEVLKSLVASLFIFKPLISCSGVKKKGKWSELFGNQALIGFGIKESCVLLALVIKKVVKI